MGGGWKLVRRVKAGDSWHPATDQLVGSHAYGGFKDNPNVDKTFSRRWDTEAYDQFLFVTGDAENWLVADRKEVLQHYWNTKRQVVASSISHNSPYRARWNRRKGHKEQPWISLRDYQNSIDNDLVLYEEGGSKTGSVSVLAKHKGASVFIRQRDYKVYVMGCCNFRTQGFVSVGGRIWSNREFVWKNFPSFLDGATLAHSPYREIPQGSGLHVAVTHPSVVYVLVAQKESEKDGGLHDSLPGAGWTLLPRTAHWTMNDQDYCLSIFRKLADSAVSLPKTTTEQTVLAIAAKRRYSFRGYDMCIGERELPVCYFQAKKTDSHTCQRNCNMIDECLGWSNKPDNECFLYFAETSGPVLTKKLEGYKGFAFSKEKCGGNTIVKSSGSSEDSDTQARRDLTKSCFSKSECEERLEVEMFVGDEESGGERFGPQVALTPYSQIWSDKKYQFFHGITDELLGSTIIRTPYKLHAAQPITVDVSGPCWMYIVLNEGCSWAEALEHHGWTKRKSSIRWKHPMILFSRLVEHTFQLPQIPEEGTTMGIMFKQTLLSEANAKCFAGLLHNKDLRESPFVYKDEFPTRDDCREKCAGAHKSYGFSYFTDGYSSQCRCGKTGKAFGQLMTERHHGLFKRKPCEVNDVSVFGWCTCETLAGHDDQRELALEAAHEKYVQTENENFKKQYETLKKNELTAQDRIRQIQNLKEKALAGELSPDVVMMKTARQVREEQVADMDAVWEKEKKSMEARAKVRLANLEKDMEDLKARKKQQDHDEEEMSKHRMERGKAQDRAERQERAERFERYERATRAERQERSERSEIGERGAHGEIGERGLRAERSSVNERADRADRTERADQLAHIERFERAERGQRNMERGHRDRHFANERSMRQNHEVRMSAAESEKRAMKIQKMGKEGASPEEVAAADSRPSGGQTTYNYNSIYFPKVDDEPETQAKAAQPLESEYGVQAQGQPYRMMPIIARPGFYRPMRGDAATMLRGEEERRIRNLNAGLNRADASDFSHSIRRSDEMTQNSRDMYRDISDLDGEDIDGLDQARELENLPPQ